MRRILLAAAATIAATMASADNFSGVITQISADKRDFTLDQGRTFTVPQNIPLPPELELGSRVTVTTHPETSEVQSVLISQQ